MTTKEEEAILNCDTKSKLASDFIRNLSLRLLHHNFLAMTPFTHPRHCDDDEGGRSNLTLRY
jgi:hypothetical protein